MRFKLLRIPMRMAAPGLLVGLTPVLASAQVLGGAAAPQIDYLRVLLSLGFCLLLGLGVLFWLKRKFPQRFAQAAPSKLVRVLETTRLNVKAALYVVEFDGRRFLIAADANGMVPIANTEANTAKHTAVEQSSTETKRGEGQ